MRKAPPLKGTAAAKSLAMPEEKCPVLPIALRVGELWDAHAGAEERDHDKVAEQISEMRCAAEKAASFKQARSLPGALFQVALALEEANVLDAMLPSEDQGGPSYLKLCRLLDLVAITLRDAMGADYEAVKNVVAVYMHIDKGSMQWLDEIPAMAREWRAKAARLSAERG
jgi:hypothetical protein